MRYFLFVNNPFNITKREYWTPKAITIRLTVSVATHLATKYATRKILEAHEARQLQAVR